MASHAHDQQWWPRFNVSEPTSVSIGDYKEWYNLYGTTVGPNITDCSLEEEMNKVRARFTDPKRQRTTFLWDNSRSRCHHEVLRWNKHQGLNASVTIVGRWGATFPGPLKNLGRTIEYSPGMKRKHRRCCRWVCLQEWWKHAVTEEWKENLKKQAERSRVYLTGNTIVSTTGTGVVRLCLKIKVLYIFVLFFTLHTMYRNCLLKLEFEPVIKETHRPPLVGNFPGATSDKQNNMLCFVEERRKLLCFKIRNVIVLYLFKWLSK